MTCPFVRSEQGRSSSFPCETRASAPGGTA